MPSGKVLWLYGAPNDGVGDVYHPHWHKAQMFKERKHRVFSDVHEITETYDAVVIDCPQQREETEGLIALALKHSAGMVMALAPGNAGGGRLGKMMETYGVSVGRLSKDRCKVVWTMEAPKAAPELRDANVKYLEPHAVMIGDTAWWSVPGIFGWDKVDVGSRLLLECIPSLTGRVADFGCGYGYLATSLTQRDAAIESMDAFDVDARAVACCARNAGEKVKAQWADIRACEATPRYHAVVMNPPFHSGKAEDISLGKDFIQKGWQALLPGGSLYLVANKHLPYEKMVPGLCLIGEDEGFKMMRTRKP